MNISEKLAKVKLIVSDFDGVMTDNRVIVDQDGRESVVVSRADGQGINILKECGVKVIILSTEKNPVVQRRADKLGIDCIQGVGKKDEVLLKYCKDNDISLNDVAYVGNDINDYAAMKLVAVRAVPSDAYDNVKCIADVVLDVNGGAGVIRKLADEYVKAKKRYLIDE